MNLNKLLSNHSSKLAWHRIALSLVLVSLISSSCSEVNLDNNIQTTETPAGLAAVPPSTPTLIPSPAPFVTPTEAGLKVVLDGSCKEYSEDHKVVNTQREVPTVYGIFNDDQAILCIPGEYIKDVYAGNKGAPSISPGFVLEKKEGVDVYIIDITEYRFDIGSLDGSRIGLPLVNRVWGEDVEFILNASDFGLDGNFKELYLRFIHFMLDGGTDVEFTSFWSSFPQVLISDVARITDNAPNSQILTDRLFGLPDGYHVKSLMSPPIGDLFGVAISETGYIYAQSFGAAELAGIHVYDPYTGKVTRIRDNAGGIGIFEGPGDTIFIKDGGKISSLHPDGSTDVWATMPSGISPNTFTPDSRMFGTVDGNTVVEIFPDGTYRTIADGFQDIQAIAEMPDGALIVSEFLIENGRITRIETDGTKTILFRGTGDSSPYLKTSPDGNLFINASRIGFVKMDPRTGKILKQYTLGYSGGPCSQGFGFSFLDETHIAFASNTLGSILIANLEDQSVENLLGGYPVNVPIAVDNDGLLYAATSICDQNQMIPVILTINQDREIDIRYQIESSVTGRAFDDLAVDAKKGIYFLLSGVGSDSRLQYLPPGKSQTETIQIPNIPIDHSASAEIAINPVSGNLFLAAWKGSSIYELLPDRTIVSHMIDYPEDIVFPDIAFSDSGELFLAASGYDGWQNGPQTTVYLMKVDLESGNATTVFSWIHEGIQGGAKLTFNQADNKIYAHTNGDLDGVIRVDLDGNVERFAWMKAYGLDAIGIASDQLGNIYLAGPNGIFLIYAEE